MMCGRHRGDIAIEGQAEIQKKDLYYNHEKYPLSPLKPRGPGAFFTTRTLKLRFREFGAPIIYMIPFP